MLQQGTLAVTLHRSPIGRTAKHKACIAGLGLRKVGQTRVLEDTPAVRGMVKKIQYMVHVEYGS